MLFQYEEIHESQKNQWKTLFVEDTIPFVQEVENDKCVGLHGVQYESPVSPGFGFYKP